MALSGRFRFVSTLLLCSMALLTHLSITPCAISCPGCRRGARLRFRCHEGCEVAHRNIFTAVTADIDETAHNLSQLFRIHGFPLETLNAGIINPRRSDPFLIAAHWDAIQSDVERTIQTGLQLEKPPSLPLLFTPQNTTRGQLLRVFFPDPDDPRIKLSLMLATNARPELFVQIKVVSKQVHEATWIQTSGFRPELRRPDGTLDLSKAAIRMSDCLRKDVASALVCDVPVEQPRIRADAVKILSGWVIARQDDNARYYWRIHATLEKDSTQDEIWALNIKIDLGYRSRHMSAIRWTGDHVRNPDLANSMVATSSLDPSSGKLQQVSSPVVITKSLGGGGITDLVRPSVYSTLPRIAKSVLSLMERALLTTTEQQWRSNR